jgi:hypothetical protein
MNGNCRDRPSRIPAVLVPAVVVVLLLAACGESPDGSPGADKHESSGRRPTKILFGLLHSYTSGPLNQCPLTAALRAGFTRQNPIHAERLTAGRFCLRGFHKDGPLVHLVLTGPLPAETQEARDLDPIKPIKDPVLHTYGPVHYTYWKWVERIVLKPVGDYKIHATQESRTSDTSLEANGRLRVVPATEPTIYNGGEQEASYPPGASFQIQFSGFPPNSQVMVFLYGPGVKIGKRDEYEYPFLRPLPLAQMDAHGEASYSLASRPDDRPGEYGIWMNPLPRWCREDELCGPCAADEPCARFEIES